MSDAVITSSPTSGLAPAPPPLDTREARDELACRLCGYSLRGLAAGDPTGSRCPECGYPFRWAELLAARQHRHPYLFEQYPRRNVWSFVRTVLGGMRPCRFWSSLNAAHSVRAGRLVAYWVMVALLVLVTGVGGGLIASGVTTYRDHLRQRALAQTPRWGMSSPMMNWSFPLPPDPRFFKLVWDNHDQRGLAMYLTVAALAWSWLSLVTLLIFRHAMRAARIRPGHVLRCVVYSGDVFLWLGPLSVALAYVWPHAGFGSIDNTPEEARRVVTCMAALAAVFVYRLGMAYRRYLRLSQPWATVALSQITVALFVVTALSLLSSDFFWLMF